MSKAARPSEKSFDRSIVEGPIPGVVWKLAWPTMLQNVLGGLQGIVDHAMVGNFVGFTGNAAIGVAWQIFLVVIVFISSLFTGMGVLVARFVGAREPDKVNRTVYQAFLTAAVMSIGILAPLGYVLSPWLLGLVNAAPDVQAEALQYLRIMFLYSFGMIVYFMVGGALRSAGDARTPLRLGIMLTTLNITLNLVLIPGWGPIPAFGTTGAAMGTVIAGGVMAAVSIYLLFAGKWVVGFRRGMDWRPDFRIIRELFRFGIPTGLQGVAMNVGGVMLLAFIGSLPQSGEAQAAYVITYTQLFSMITWTSAGLLGATAAVSGQNLGAGLPERTIHAVHVASGIGLAVAAGVGVLFLTIPHLLLGFFGVEDPLVTQMAVRLLMFLSASGLFITVALVYTGGLQGTGDTRSPFYISLVSQLIIPIGICAILQATVGLEATYIWMAILIGHITRCALSVIRFRQGKWRNIKVSIEPAGA
jgi:putative MATE family efflux protein